MSSTASFIFKCISIAIVIGIYVYIAHMLWSSNLDTRECTILCPGQAESIRYQDACYCKVEADK